MKRLRLLRLLVPVALVAFAAIVVIALRERPPGPDGSSERFSSTGNPSARLEGFTITDIVGDRRRLVVSARVGRWDEAGGFQAEGIDRIELDREGGSPLIVSAARGHGTGEQGKRVLRLEGGVEIRDEEAGILVKIPTAELDQGAGFARSVGEVIIVSPRLSGRASAAVYPLDGRPAEFYGLEFRDDGGSVLRAGRAWLPRGGGVVELEGDVRLTRGSDALRAEHFRLERDASGGLKAVEAAGAVHGSSLRPGSISMRFQAVSANVSWANRLVDRIALQREALVEHGSQTLRADTIVISRRSDGWDVASSGGVVLAGALPTGSGRLEAASLDAALDGSGAIEHGRAAGGVRFAGKDAAGEGDVAELTRTDVDERVTLRSGGERRARLAAGRIRVTADTIVTSGRGTRLSAEGRVEATLLPDGAGGGLATRAALFDGEAAIHFVSARLDAEESGKVLRFRQNVRGWQADRNISADEVDVDQRIDALDARGRVATRLPRSRAPAMAAGFLQVSSESLRYRGFEALATYRGGVRARTDEGSIACGRLEIAVAKSGGGIEEVRGYESVRLEFRAPPTPGSAAPEPVTGVGDRLVFAPGAGWVRLFGDRAPAEVRRGGPKGGTTAGRVLRYALESGHIEVESGSTDRNGPARGEP